ncbi:DNA-methyltransferase [Salinibaculum rarum]|uniref:DNA-methyltransferase n=1 Tax=Salinibaculum rarum TaxID=3058903 RepID=UPI00265EE446|nr:site-specific DNA-methyltransferase [Salinibaculum sp. KK48]
MSDAPHQQANESHNRNLRLDGYLFEDDYLTGSNPELAARYLWPVPVFERMREDMVVTIGEQEIRPGDVLEYCGGDYEEYLLVVAELPAITGEVGHHVRQGTDWLLLYSSNAETYRVFDARAFTNEANKFIKHDSGRYAVHEDAAALVEVGSDSPSDTAFPPKPLHDGPEGPGPRIQQQYPHEHPPTTVMPRNPISKETRPIEEFINEVTQGDAFEVLSEMPDNSVHACITSPPYLEMRDYGAGGQLGQETSVAAFIENLLSVVRQLMRVVRKDGLGWLILDDSYQDGAIAGIPERLVQELQTEGFDIIHHSPWVKPNTKPEAVSKRYSHTHEHLICIAHSDGDHYFNRENTEDPSDVFKMSVGQTDTDHDAPFPVELPRELIRTTVPEKVCAECGAPYTPMYEVTDIRNLPTDRPQSQRALELADRHDLTDEHLWALRSRGLGDTGQAKRTQDGTGKNRAEVENLAAEAEDALGSYAREFLNAQKEQTDVKASCDCDTNDTEPGIVLDPFFGAGTTGVAARELRRRWIGIELNDDYVVEAESRIGVDVSDPSKLRDDNQETLTEF